MKARAAELGLRHVHLNDVEPPAGVADPTTWRPGPADFDRIRVACVRARMRATHACPGEYFWWRAYLSAWGARVGQVRADADCPGAGGSARGHAAASGLGQ